MKLKTFNPDVLPNIYGKNQQPRISLHFKSGLISINEVACEMIGLKPDDYVEVYQDEEDPENWYLAKTNKSGWVLRPQNKGAKGLRFSNKELCRLMMDSVGAKPSTPGVRIPIAGEPTKLGKQTLYGLLVIAAKRQS